jgi:hypothetical protein
VLTTNLFLSRILVEAIVHRYGDEMLARQWTNLRLEGALAFVVFSDGTFLVGLRHRANLRQQNTDIRVCF